MLLYWLSSQQLSYTQTKSIYFVTRLEQKHPVYIISQTKCTTNIFVWRSGLKTWFHTDCHHSNYQMLKGKVFCGLAWECLVVYIISHKCAANIFVWQSGLRTFHGDYWLQQYNIYLLHKRHTFEWKYSFHGLTWKHFAVYLIRHLFIIYLFPLYLNLVKNT